MHGIFDAAQGIEHFRIELALIPDGADDCTFRAAGNICIQPEALNFRYHATDLLIGGAAVHDDDQADPPVAISGPASEEVSNAASRCFIPKGISGDIPRATSSDFRNFLFS